MKSIIAQVLKTVTMVLIMLFYLSKNLLLQSTGPSSSEDKEVTTL
jgi:hypothetical protein